MTIKSRGFKTNPIVPPPSSYSNSYPSSSLPPNNLPIQSNPLDRNMDGRVDLNDFNSQNNFVNAPIQTEFLPSPYESVPPSSFTSGAGTNYPPSSSIQTGITDRNGDGRIDERDSMFNQNSNANYESNATTYASRATTLITSNATPISNEFSQNNSISNLPLNSSLPSNSSSISYAPLSNFNSSSVTYAPSTASSISYSSLEAPVLERNFNPTSHVSQSQTVAPSGPTMINVHPMTSYYLSGQCYTDYNEQNNQSNLLSTYSLPTSSSSSSYPTQAYDNRVEAITLQQLDHHLSTRATSPSDSLTTYSNLSSVPLQNDQYPSSSFAQQKPLDSGIQTTTSTSIYTVPIASLLK